MGNENNLLQLVILALATWRLSYMLVNDNGPLKIFFKARNRLQWALLDCVWCVSVWVAALAIFSLILCPPVLWVWVIFAISGGAILIDKLVG